MPDADRLHVLLAKWEGRILAFDWLDDIEPESRTARIAVRAEGRREAIRECADELRAALTQTDA
jgi:(p)ppGpp synthase/HD superfamily hydrolase